MTICRKVANQLSVHLNGRPVLLLVAHIKGGQIQCLCIEQNTKLVAALGLLNSMAPLKGGQSCAIINLMESKEQSAVQWFNSWWFLKYNPVRLVVHQDQCNTMLIFILNLLGLSYLIGHACGLPQHVHLAMKKPSLLLSLQLPQHIIRTRATDQTGHAEPCLHAHQGNAS